MSTKAIIPIGKSARKHEPDYLLSCPVASIQLRNPQIINCGLVLFGDYFYEDAVGEGGGAEEVDYAVAGEAAEHGGGFGGRFGLGESEKTRERVLRLRRRMTIFL